LTSALDGEWSASRPCRFTLAEISIGLEAMEKRKILPLPRIEPRAVQHVTHWAIPRYTSFSSDFDVLFKRRDDVWADAWLPPYANGHGNAVDPPCLADVSALWFS
jgi:hypothetical protein